MDGPVARRYEPLPREALAGRAAKELRVAILDGTYAPGDRLPSERELAEQFGVDRHTLRSAVHELELLGLVTRRQGAGAHVLPYHETATLDLVPHLVTKPGTDDPDLDVIASIVEVERFMFVGMVTLMVQRADEDDFAAMHEAFAKLRTAAPSGNIHEVAVTKLALIRSMFRATHSIVCELFANTYQNMLRGAIDPTGRLRDLWAQRVAASTHELFGALITAAERRDVTSAQDLVNTILDEMVTIRTDPQAEPRSSEAAAGVG